MSDLKIFSEDIPINGKRVIVRLDLNVPINNSKIDDYTRIEIIESFVNKLIEDNNSNLYEIDGDLPNDQLIKICYFKIYFLILLQKLSRLRSRLYELYPAQPRKQNSRKNLVA